MIPFDPRYGQDACRIAEQSIMLGRQPLADNTCYMNNITRKTQNLSMTLGERHKPLTIAPVPNKLCIRITLVHFSAVQSVDALNISQVIFFQLYCN